MDLENSLRHIRSLLIDVEQITGVSMAHDSKTVVRRVRYEGLSFITITLPNLCTSFERWLEVGRVERTDNRSFRYVRGVPQFLGGLFMRVFDQSGVLLEDPCVDSILCLRQILLLYKKPSIPCSPERVDKAIQGYLDVEAALDLIEYDYDLFGRVSDSLWPRILGRVDARCYENLLVPRHGPGAVAERLTSNGKYAQVHVSERVQKAFPLDSYFVSSCDQEDYERIEVLPSGAEPVGRLVTVPKTLKAPRIICIEPSSNQYAQQSIMAELYDAISISPIGKVLNFRDQSRNRSLALLSSVSREFTTMDLSEASDRVHYMLVKRMLKRLPNLWEKIDACRTTRIELPDGTIVTPRKFASMGSAVCFPVEAMVFLTLIITSQIRQLGCTPSFSRAISIARESSVYGDDLVVPRSWTSSVRAELEAACLKVNGRKTFSTGLFRESCGLDAYNGYDVTPTYVRHMTPASRTDAQGIVSWIATANQLYKKGFWYCSSYMREVIEKLVGPLTYGDIESDPLQWFSFSHMQEIHGWHHALQKPKYLGLCKVDVIRADPLDGYGALHKCLTYRGVEPRQADHLASSGRPVSSSVKRRWKPLR